MEEQGNQPHIKKLTPIWKAILEVDFIIFLFYSNLLMGEFTRSRSGQGNSLLWAIKDIFTITNIVIGILLALIGHLIFEFVRKRL